MINNNYAVVLSICPNSSKLMQEEHFKIKMIFNDWAANQALTKVTVI